MWWFLIPLIIGAIIVASICLSDVIDWFKSKNISQNDVCKIFREKLESGKVKVISGIFNNDKVKEANQWEAEELDEDFKSLFGNKDYAYITI